MAQSESNWGTEHGDRQKKVNITGIHITHKYTHARAHTRTTNKNIEVRLGVVTSRGTEVRLFSNILGMHVRFLLRMSILIDLLIASTC